MTTKKLNALLETASDEDKALINEVLKTRESITTPASEADPEPEVVTAEMPVAEDAEDVEAPKSAVAVKSTKLTPEELKVFADDLRAKYVNHRCEVVPFNTAEWVEGVIVGIIEEKRSAKAMFAVLTNDGRRIVKTHDSKLIRISDEVVEVEKKTRGRKVKPVELDENGNPIVKEAKSDIIPFTDEEAKIEVEKYIANVGKKVSYIEAGKGGIIEEGAPTISGRIISAFASKRNRSVLYRILIDGTADKCAHKVASNERLKLEDELDEEGKELNEKAIARFNKEPRQKVIMNTAEKYSFLKDKLNLAEEKAEYWAKMLEQHKSKLAEFEEANKEEIAKLLEEAAEPEAAEPTTEELDELA